MEKLYDQPMECAYNLKQVQEPCYAYPLYRRSYPM